MGAQTMVIRKLLGAVTASAVLVAMPMLAFADTYPTDSGSQDFAVGRGGWTQSSQSSGPCASSPPCPVVVSDWNGSGGADGNGYIRTRFATDATTQAGTSTGIWESTKFTYNGNDGKVPEKVTFNLNVQSNVSVLRGASNTVTYRVDLVEKDTGKSIGVIPTTDLQTDLPWTAVPSAAVNPGLLQLGSRYRIRITTSYNFVAAVTAAGEVGFDNVRLTTTGTGPGGGGGDDGIGSRRELKNLTKTYILPASAKVVGNKLEMKLRCPAKAAPEPCKVQVQGLAKGKFSKPATARAFVTIKAGRSKLAKLRIKPKYVAAYKAASRIWVKSTVRVGSLEVTVRKREKLIH
jgi:hypothetical protein